MKLSEHFTLRELTKSSTAERFGIDNNPNSDEMKALKKVCEEVLEPVRHHWGVPFAPNSGFRSKELNEKLGGSQKSQHMFGEAVDIEVPGVSNLELAYWIKNQLQFDQLILECWTGKPDSGWVHVSYKDINRKEVLTYERKKGYTPGLP